MNVIQKHIERLAISYHAYCVAMEGDDLNSQAVWGQSLLEDQEATGVELTPQEGLRQFVDYVRAEKAA